MNLVLVSLFLITLVPWVSWFFSASKLRDEALWIHAGFVTIHFGTKISALTAFNKLDFAPAIFAGVKTMHGAYICDGATVRKGATIGENSRIFSGVEIPAYVHVPRNSFVINFPTTAELIHFLGYLPTSDAKCDPSLIVDEWSCINSSVLFLQISRSACETWQKFVSTCSLCENVLSWYILFD